MFFIYSYLNENYSLSVSFLFVLRLIFALITHNLALMLQVDGVA